ncbi:unnamed protein product [Fraxinus pennsylvanica]|uniref:Uncharacterized protein n=1 Tax=Fraxinus pennsylvanica TaxID=56036 RepID=A0AAD2AE22_9LAMI|nr:unnamed protein product [Fraxinus pennsylvanica]
MGLLYKSPPQNIISITRRGLCVKIRTGAESESIIMEKLSIKAVNNPKPVNAKFLPKPAYEIFEFSTLPRNQFSNSRAFSALPSPSPSYAEDFDYKAPNFDLNPILEELKENEDIVKILVKAFFLCTSHQVYGEGEESSSKEKREKEVIEDARARAERLRSYKADLQKIKKEKEEAEQKRLEALKLKRQKRIVRGSSTSVILSVLSPQIAQVLNRMILEGVLLLRWLLVVQCLAIPSKLPPRLARLVVYKKKPTAYELTLFLWKH